MLRPPPPYPAPPPSHLSSISAVNKGCDKNAPPGDNYVIIYVKYMFSGINIILFKNIEYIVCVCTCACTLVTRN